MSLLAGGVANSVYASDNADAYDAIEPFCDAGDIPSGVDLEDFCDDLKRLRDSEIAAAVSYCRTHAPVALCYTLLMHGFVNVCINQIIHIAKYFTINFVLIAKALKKLFSIQKHY